MIPRRKICAAILLFCGMFVGLMLINCVNPASSSTDASPDLWRKSFTIDSNSVLITALCKTAANGVYVAGNIYLADGNTDMFVLKADKDGNQQWLKKYKWIGTDSTAGICATADSGFALTGIAKRFSIFHGNKNGDSLWIKEYGWGFGFGRGIIGTSDGGMALTGQNGISYSSTGCLIRTDSSGTQIFLKDYESNTLGGRIVEMSDGSLTVFADKDSNDLDPTVAPAIIAARISPTGTIIWKKKISLTAHKNRVVGAAQGQNEQLVIAIDTITTTENGMVMAVSGAGDSLWTVPVVSGPVFSMSTTGDGNCFVFGKKPCLEERRLTDGSIAKQKDLDASSSAHHGVFAGDGYVLAGEDTIPGTINVIKLRRL
jgi:hypothetical protein